VESSRVTETTATVTPLQWYQQSKQPGEEQQPKAFCTEDRDGSKAMQYRTQYWQLNSVARASAREVIQCRQQTVTTAVAHSMHASMMFMLKLPNI
jgi:hypothetical protein